MTRDTRMSHEDYERLLELRKLIGANPDHEVTIREYGILNWRCEVLQHAVGGMRFPGSFNVLEIHHIAGRGKGAECVGNWISLHKPVHDWITDHSKPGFVLCAYAKTVKDEADWDVWSSLKPTYRRSWLETDECIEACAEWGIVEDMRQKLIANH